jgi:metal-sulfur cluster biosynthetic enzyme
MFSKDDIVAAIKTVFDPEIPVNVWDLGLIYSVECGIEGNKSHSAPDCRKVIIKMTMTSPTCPMAEELLTMVRLAAESVAGAGKVEMQLVWEPPWTLSRMSPSARLELDLTEEGW